MMVGQKRKTYTKTTPMGHEVTVTEMSREDVEQELAEFEAKYGMSSQEFAGKWNRGEMDCAVMDYFDWAGDCGYMAEEHGMKKLKIIHRNIQELRLEAHLKRLN